MEIVTSKLQDMSRHLEEVIEDKKTRSLLRQRDILSKSLSSTSIDSKLHLRRRQRHSVDKGKKSVGSRLVVDAPQSESKKSTSWSHDTYQYILSAADGECSQSSLYEDSQDRKDKPEPPLYRRFYDMMMAYLKFKGESKSDSNVLYSSDPEDADRDGEVDIEGKSTKSLYATISHLGEECSLPTSDHKRWECSPLDDILENDSSDPAEGNLHDTDWYIDQVIKRYSDVHGPDPDSTQSDVDSDPEDHQGME